jgi:hypothetical protein
MIEIGLTGLAQYIDADDAAKRRVLQEHKFPSGDRIAYYGRAIVAIRRLHAGVMTTADLVALARQLEARGRAARTTQGRRRYEHNAKAILAYVELFGQKLAPILPRRRGLDITHGGVLVRATPEMSIQVKRREVLVRLHCGAEALSEREGNVLAQCMFEAARQAGLTTKSSSIVIYDVRRGTKLGGARMGSRMAAVIKAALINIETLWPTIQPPLRRKRA